MAVTPLSSGMWGGKFTIATDAAKAGAATAAGIAKLKAKQDKEDNDAYNAVLKSITPTKGLHRLLEKPAAELYGNAVIDILKRKQSGNPNWINEAAQVGADYVQGAANLKQISDNYNGFKKAIENPSLFHSKKDRDLYDKMNKADRIETFRSNINPTEISNIDPQNLTIDYNRITSTPRRDVNKELASSFGQISPIEGKNIIKVGDKQFHEQVILPTDADAKAWAKQNGVDPSYVKSVESTVNDRFMNDKPFLEQYVDQKQMDLGGEDVYTMGPENTQKIKDALIKDGTPFLEAKYKTLPGGIKIYNNIGEGQDVPFKFSKNAYDVRAEITQGNKLVSKRVLGFSFTKPIDARPQDYTIVAGTVNRNLLAQEVSQEHSNQSITGVTILPQKGVLKDGVTKYMPIYGDEINVNTLFAPYLQYSNGNYSPLAVSGSNLQFNVGGKNPVAEQQKAFVDINNYKEQLNMYQKRMRQIVSKNPNYKPELYTQVKKYMSGEITPDDYNNWINNFKFDK
jgi:hypothetical protein